MKRHLTLVWLAMGFLLMLVPFTFVSRSSVSASYLKLPWKPASAMTQEQSRSDVIPKSKQPNPHPPKLALAPSNDNCANAIPITSCPFDSETDTGGATNEAGEPGSTCTTQSNSVWYGYSTGAGAANVTVSTCNSDFDTAIMVWKVTGPPCAFAGFVAVTCNDDFCGDGLQSTVQFIADANSNYKIQIGGFAGETGNLSVHVECTVLLCPQIVVNGTLGSGSPDRAGVSGQQTPNRLFRDGIPSTCGVPKLTCPGTFNTGSFTFDAYPFTNQSGQPQCVIIDYDPDTPAGACGANAHCTVYSGNYVPTNVCQNYLADVGASQHQSFSFNVGVGATFFVVVAANNSGVGNGCKYKFTLVGNICSQFDICVQDDSNPKRFVQINSQTGEYKFTDCGKGLTLSGQGGVVSSACKTELFDQGPNPKKPDRFVDVTVNPCKMVANATIEFGSNSISLHDSNITNNTCDCTAIVVPCAVICPDDLITDNGPIAAQCGRNVTYPPPGVVGGCGPATCTPASGSFFSVGSTLVTCTLPGVAHCSFTIVVADIAPARITCPAGIVTAPAPGQSSATVNYPAATVTANCPGATVQCSPPAGSRFPLGTTLVACAANYPSLNSADCVFSVMVIDSEPPVIRCPANLTAGTQPGQTSAVVTYLPPSVTDNVPGASVVCAPASGSSFPLGVTTITCTATDVAGNKASCSFTAGVGGPQVQVIIPGSAAVIEFGNPIAVAPVRKPLKEKNNPCRSFTIQNIGFAPLVLTFDSVTRTGSDADFRKFVEVNDTRYFTLSLVDASSTPIDFGGVVTIQPGAAQSFCLRFSALIPALAGRTTAVAAAEILPDTVTSRVTFSQNAGSPVSVPVLTHIATGVVFINGTNPRQPPTIGFTRSGNDLIVSYALYDANLDVSRAKYEFLGSGGQMVGPAFEIDLSEKVRTAGLLRGQSFAVEQSFTSDIAHPEITGVRVTVFDGETSASESTTAASVTTSARLLNRTAREPLLLPAIRLNANLP